ncbi:hypothetical protein CMUS01_13658 [Colletotrichum musicola]|uniref:Uncharacterized protein n=1 Tax=Colletotrichum musicola TaxID=2175873 RepID=A0A8H6JAZ9_9PEZI|nr:hypothetical protein CMUS01_13658 [Colletotrichum musicola]
MATENFTTKPSALMKLDCLLTMRLSLRFMMCA